LAQLIRLWRSGNGFDLENEASIADHARQLGDLNIHLLICATGIPTIEGVGPEKSLRRIDHDVMLKQFKVNAIGPALVAILPSASRPSGAFGRSIPICGSGLYR